MWLPLPSRLVALICLPVGLSASRITQFSYDPKFHEKCSCEQERNDFFRDLNPQICFDSALLWGVLHICSAINCYGIFFYYGSCTVVLWLMVLYKLDISVFEKSQYGMTVDISMYGQPMAAVCTLWVLSLLTMQTAQKTKWRRCKSRIWQEERLLDCDNETREIITQGNVEYPQNVHTDQFYKKLMWRWHNIVTNGHKRYVPCYDCSYLTLHWVRSQAMAVIW